MKLTKHILTISGILIVAFGVNIVLPAESRPQPAGASQSAPFDHSQCQYPTRTTNPPDGCDNSDPCDPASAAKGGSGECAPVTSPQTNTNPVTTAAPSDPNKCGGAK